MDPLTALLAIMVFIAAWYTAAGLIFRKVNPKVAGSCGCRVVKFAGDPSSLYVDLECPEGKVGVFIRRAPWDNPFNLMFFYAVGRSTYVVTRFAAPLDLGVMDAARRGKGKRVGSFYVVNTSTPKEVLQQLLSWGEEVGAWRISTSGRAVQLMWRGNNCKKAVEATRSLMERFRHLLKDNTYKD
ncbi:MAG: hypothetical protein QXS00_00930 [Pyrobaculum sp.]|uniref:hypothetical protein n=1 Tax=Pyrobaculum sp. TaxID=2004705 RepID=UPI003163929E